MTNEKNVRRNNGNKNSKNNSDGLLTSRRTDGGKLTNLPTEIEDLVSGLFDKSILNRL